MEFWVNNGVFYVIMMDVCNCLFLNREKKKNIMCMLCSWMKLWNKIMNIEDFVSQRFYKKFSMLFWATN